MRRVVGLQPILLKSHSGLAPREPATRGSYVRPTAESAAVLGLSAQSKGFGLRSLFGRRCRRIHISGDIADRFRFDSGLLQKTKVTDPIDEPVLP
jgi:hypothetical protein